jgi:hypothetical protein
MIQSVFNRSFRPFAAEGILCQLRYVYPPSHWVHRFFRRSNLRRRLHFLPAANRTSNEGAK